MITRADWGARAPTQTTPLNSKSGGFIIHHTAASGKNLSHWPDCWRRWRGHQSYHMDRKGWSDIAYNALVCAHGFWFEGRGWESRNGANAPVNASTFSICWEGTLGDPVDPAVVATINRIISEGVGRGWAPRVRGHNQVRPLPTSCPGELRALIKDGTLTASPQTPITPPVTVGTPILGDNRAGVQKALKWAAGLPIECVIPIYYMLAPQLGVRADVAVAQSAKETNYGRFTGVVTPGHHNWAGLKTTQGGSNADPDAHARFPDDYTGILAHLQHLKLYADGPVSNPVDPRHFPELAGTATTVEALGRRWAPSPTYGHSIVTQYLTPILEA